MPAKGLQPDVSALPLDLKLTGDRVRLDTGRKFFPVMVGGPGTGCPEKLWLEVLDKPWSNLG